MTSQRFRVLPETFQTALERHSLFMISRDVSVAKRSLTFHSQLICNRGIPMGRGSREEKWRDTRVVSHASVTRTGTNYNLNDASCGEKRVPAAILISPPVCHSSRGPSTGIVLLTRVRMSLARNHVEHLHLQVFCYCTILEIRYYGIY